MDLRKHMLEMHHWHMIDEGFESMDEVARIDSHNQDHDEHPYGSHSHCPEPGCDKLEETPHGDMNPECPIHGSQLDNGGSA